MNWPDMNWMAWTMPTALFFAAIAASIGALAVLHVTYPSPPRTGVLGIETMRGDRFFITLLGSAFINLAWIQKAAISNSSTQFKHLHMYLKTR